MTKHLFTVSETAGELYVEMVPEGTQVLLQGQPFSDRVQVFVPIGYLNKSEDLASKIGQYVHGRRWGTLTRNDGHYLEVEIEEHETEGTVGAKDA